MSARARRFPDLCRDLFMLAQVHEDPSRGPGRGWRWESSIATMLGARGFPVESTPGGVRVFGVLPASGLRHQTDAAIGCSDALVIGEWKSFSGPVPKNEVLRFKAVSDDVYDAMSSPRPPRRPVLRLFGVAGDASPELRWYAARHGITLVERSRWPAPVLADRRSDLWRAAEGPDAIDAERLAWLSRPLQVVYPRMSDGSLRLPPAPPRAAVQSLLALQERWSDRLWRLLDAQPGRFEECAGSLAA